MFYIITGYIGYTGYLRLNFPFFYLAMRWLDWLGFKNIAFCV